MCPLWAIRQFHPFLFTRDWQINAQMTFRAFQQSFNRKALDCQMCEILKSLDIDLFMSIIRQRHAVPTDAKGLQSRQLLARLEIAVYKSVPSFHVYLQMLEMTEAQSAQTQLLLPDAQRPKIGHLLTQPN